MKHYIRFFALLLVLTLLPQIHLHAQQPPDIDWRFGFEYIEVPPPFGTTEANHDTLLSRLGYVTSSQRVRGAININLIGGGWAGMQDTEDAALNFTEPDAWVRRLQRNGFELIWNLNPNAEWSYINNPDCIKNSGLDKSECAPDVAHEEHWKEYVRALVERYDGDGIDDMPGLEIPVRFYVMMQEVYFDGSAGGDASEAEGKGFWEDGVENLIRLHALTYQAMRQADPSGTTKLVGSGGLLFDLFSDFPDYPNIDGPTIQARLAGNNLSGATYTRGFDSLLYLVQRLGDDSDGKKCDYMGWHPHMGWKAIDQCMKIIKTLAPDKPIFIDDMWSAMFTTELPYPGYAQFIGGAEIERDFPNATVGTFTQLFNGLQNGNHAITAWNDAKMAREAVKCFATVFGEGAERVSYSLSCDANPHHPLYLFSQPWRFSGLVRNVDSNYAMKPVTHTMKLLVDKLHDFTTVERMPISESNYTRCYKFQRKRGTPCYVLWSEATQSPEDPLVPNGETISFQAGSDSVIITHIITEQGVTTPAVTGDYLDLQEFSMQLGHTPVIVEEYQILTSAPASVARKERQLYAFPNPATGTVQLRFVLAAPETLTPRLSDISGKALREYPATYYEAGECVTNIDLAAVPSGTYILTLSGNNATLETRVEVQR